MNPKNLHTAKFIAETEAMVRFEFIAMADPADGLQVFKPVGIPRFKLADEPRRHHVVDMALHSGSAEASAAGSDFAVAANRRRAISSPSFS